METIIIREIYKEPSFGCAFQGHGDYVPLPRGQKFQQWDRIRIQAICGDDVVQQREYYFKRNRLHEVSRWKNAITKAKGGAE